MNWIRVAHTIGWQTLRRLLRSRMLWLLLAAVAACALFFLLMGARIGRRGVQGSIVFGLVGYVLWVQFALPLVALYFGIVAVQGDLEDRTSVYLFARPLPRSALLFGKWIAAAVIAASTVFLGVAALRWSLSGVGRHGLGPPASMLWAFAAVAGLGGLAYAGLGALFGAWFRRPLIAGVVFLVGWEGVVANLAADATARSFTVTDPLRRLLWDAHRPEGDYAAVLRPGFLRDVAGQDLIDPALAVARFAVVVVAVAIWVYSRREYDARTPD